MSWFKAALTRAVVGQSVHVVLLVVQPGVPVDHLLVSLIVVVVAAAMGVGGEDGAGERRLRASAKSGR